MSGKNENGRLGSEEFGQIANICKLTVKKVKENPSNVWQLCSVKQLIDNQNSFQLIFCSLNNQLIVLALIVYE